MRAAFFTIVNDAYYQLCRTDDFIRSFKRFHPDIPLVVFGQREIDEAFQNSRLNFGNAKAYFAKKLDREQGPFDLICNVDADHLICGRMTEILDADFDVACPANFNAKLNTGISMRVTTGRPGATRQLGEVAFAPFEKYLQGGLIASTSTRFWNDYEHASLKWADKFPLQENDVLNLVLGLGPFKTKVLDGAFEYTDPAFSCYYGCASLGREKQIVMDGDGLSLDGRPVRAYHVAHGKNKPTPQELFSPEVCRFITSICSD